jgi:hypothetical protein
MHLQAPMHLLNYMVSLSINSATGIFKLQYRNTYKAYHDKAIKEKDERRRDTLLHRYSFKIWNREKCGQCTKRMRCILNAEAIKRIWPECMNFIDNSWTIKDEEDIGKLININII